MQQMQSERAHSVAFLVLFTLAGLSSACGERRLDGNEYQGARSALYGAAGAAADSDKVGATCGGLLGLRCGPGEYCNFAPEALCGRADATGTCARKPMACTKEFRPVCGCDGITYGNACMAAAAGISIEHRGACEAPPGEVCGGLLGIGCPDGQYCDLAAGDGCDVSDAQGICTDQPSVCTEQFDPVCGCDGVTYGNACFAAASGASVRAPGKCCSSK